MDEKRESDLFNKAAEELVALGNKLVDEEGEEAIWSLASGLLAGAVQYWLYSRQPCADPGCDDCAFISTSQRRMELLNQEVAEFAVTSEYFITPNDRDVGQA